MDVGPVLAELRARIAEELDYRYEAEAQEAFAAAFAPAVPRTVRWCSSSDPSPHCSDSAATGASPPHDTRFGSSNVAAAT